MSKDDKIDVLLDRWNSAFSPDPNLAARVRAEAERSAQREATVTWVANALARPGLVAGFAAVFVLVGMGLSQLLPGRGRGASEELTLSYRLSIDPIYRLQAMTGAQQGFVASNRLSGEAPVLLAGLGWLQGALDLSEPQYKQVSALHSDYEAAFDDLFAQLVESYRDYQSFDRKRMENDVVDYFKLYELLQRQKRLSEESTRLTDELLSKVEQVIDPSQRARYRSLLENLYPRTASKRAGNTDA